MHQGKRLKALLKQHKMTKVDLADKLGYQRQSIYYVLDTEKFTLDLKKKLSEIFQFDFDLDQPIISSLLNEPQTPYGKKPVSIKLTIEITGDEEGVQSEFVQALNDFAKNYKPKTTQKKQPKK